MKHMSDFFSLTMTLIYFMGVLCAFTGSWKLQKFVRQIKDKKAFNRGAIIMYFADVSFASAVIFYLAEGIDIFYGIIIFAVFSFVIPAAGYQISKIFDDKKEKVNN